MWAGIWTRNPGSRGLLQTLTQVLWWSAGAILARALLDKYESASAPALLPTGSDFCLLFLSVCSAWWNIIIFITFQTRESSQQVSITLASSNSPFVNISTPLLQLRTRRICLCALLLCKFAYLLALIFAKSLFLLVIFLSVSLFKAHFTEISSPSAKGQSRQAAHPYYTDPDGILDFLQPRELFSHRHFHATSRYSQVSSEVFMLWFQYKPGIWTMWGACDSSFLLVICPSLPVYLTACPTSVNLLRLLT